MRTGIPIVKLREAHAQIAVLAVGDKVVVTDQQGKDHDAEIIWVRRGDADAFGAQCGSWESLAVGASLGRGRYVYDLSVYAVAAGKLSVRRSIV